MFDWLDNLYVDVYNAYVSLYNWLVDVFNCDATEEPEGSIIPTDEYNRQTDEYNAHVDEWNKQMSEEKQCNS